MTDVLARPPSAADHGFGDVLAGFERDLDKTADDVPAVILSLSDAGASVVAYEMLALESGLRRCIAILDSGAALPSLTSMDLPPATITGSTRRIGGASPGRSRFTAARGCGVRIGA